MRESTLNDAHFTTYEMELQIPCSVCTEVQKESILWRKKAGRRHMLPEIPPKMSASSFMGYLKGKSSLFDCFRHSAGAL